MCVPTWLRACSLYIDHGSPWCIYHYMIWYLPFRGGFHCIKCGLKRVSRVPLHGCHCKGVMGRVGHVRLVRSWHSPFVGIYPWGKPILGWAGPDGDPTNWLKGRLVQSTCFEKLTKRANRLQQVDLPSWLVLPGCLHMSTCHDSSNAMSTCQLPSWHSMLRWHVDPSRQIKSHDQLGQVDCQIDLLGQLCMSIYQNRLKAISTCQDISKAMLTGRNRSIAKSTTRSNSHVQTDLEITFLALLALLHDFC